MLGTYGIQCPSNRAGCEILKDEDDDDERKKKKNEEKGVRSALYGRCRSWAGTTQLSMYAGRFGSKKVARCISAPSCTSLKIMTAPTLPNFMKARHVYRCQKNMAVQGGTSQFENARVMKPHQNLP
ncbi:uncharacterized protein RAG0_13540 [Rhynchosporium agropyri]|uniref:Uncharacterized protein n=1 Tax=Rhynchosporium agropyri TaxID=914238 RepID=A0A1E1LD61_9HELO|nr:uncharacterized protein RAG0_13540 [Rhynchosporium agropyri]